MDVCMIKHVTDIPCPSCGSTRSVISLAKGDIQQSLNINPLGLVIALIMLVAPIWVIIDLIWVKETLFTFYKRVEYELRRPILAIPLIMLVLVNWIWNITKGL